MYYVCLYVCMYACIHTYIHAWRHTYIHTYIHTCMHTCMYVCMYVCMFLCMYVCMPACMYVCMYVCMYACMHACMYVCMHACMYVCMYVCMPVCMHACMYVCIMYVCVYVCNIRMCGCMCVYVYNNIRVFVYVIYVCMFVCIYVCTYVCLHVCIYIYVTYLCICLFARPSVQTSITICQQGPSSNLFTFSKYHVVHGLAIPAEKLHSVAVIVIDTLFIYQLPWPRSQCVKALTRNLTQSGAYRKENTTRASLRLRILITNVTAHGLLWLTGLIIERIDLIYRSIQQMNNWVTSISFQTDSYAIF